MTSQPISEDMLSAYIAYALADVDSEIAKQNFWSFDQFCTLVIEQPHEAWSAILKIVARNQNPRVIRLLAAGPMEELLVHHGREMITEVESLARENPQVASLLGGVWPNKIDGEVWKRIEAARSHRW